MKSSPLNEGRLWFVGRVVETKPDNLPPTPRGVKEERGRNCFCSPPTVPGTPQGQGVSSHSDPDPFPAHNTSRLLTSIQGG